MTDSDISHLLVPSFFFNLLVGEVNYFFRSIYKLINTPLYLI